MYFLTFSIFQNLFCEIGNQVVMNLIFKNNLVSCNVYTFSKFDSICRTKGKEGHER